MTTIPNRPRFAARLNAFRAGLAGQGARPTAADLVARAAEVPGLDAADLNYPDHFADHTPREMARVLAENGMALNGLAMRYYSDPAFALGAFTNPDPAVRRRAVELTCRGLDALKAMGGRLMTLWLGQDGFDYPFQGDYPAMWDATIDCLRAVADHAPDIDIALEYKPDDPRAFSLMPDIGTTLLAIAEAGRPNLGVTLDFAHVLAAAEMPAHSAHLAARSARLLGVHLNDGYGRRDDGLIAGAVSPVQTVELFVALRRIGWDGVIYFDTFPDAGGLDPVAEAEASIELTERLWQVAERLAHRADLADAIGRQDAAASMRIVAAELYGGGV